MKSKISMFAFITRFALALLLASLPAGLRPQAAVADQPNSGHAPIEMSLRTGGFDRTYLLYAPASLRPGASVPLVIALHGGGGNAASVLSKYKWQAAADRYGFVVAAPQALLENKSSWSDLSGRSRVEVDDVAFISALIDDVAAHARIDPRRVYATGFSSGASMSQLLGVRLSDRLAAVAPVSGHLFHEESPRRPLPVLMIFGAQDPRNPPDGGVAPGTTTTKPRQMANAEIWTRRMRCGAQPSVDHPVEAVTRSVWRGCDGDGSVEFWFVQGLGHRWAGGEPSKRGDELLGPYTAVIDDTEVIWAFFARHALPK